MNSKPWYRLDITHINKFLTFVRGESMWGNTPLGCPPTNLKRVACKSRALFLEHYVLITVK
jgi:hypothetical protein